MEVSSEFRLTLLRIILALRERENLDPLSCLTALGFDSKKLIDISSRGTIAINRTTSNLNEILDKNNGHREYFSNLFHAAFPESRLVLFVNRGVDITRPLSAQSDCFWWGYHNFSKLNKPYRTFKKIIRGYEPLISNKTINYK